MVGYTSKALRYGPCVRRDHTVLPATHTRTIPVFTPHSQSVTALWLVLIAPAHEGMARLSWPGWLVTYRKSNTDTVTHPSTNRARRRLASLIESNALPLCQTATRNKQRTDNGRMDDLKSENIMPPPAVVGGGIKMHELVS